MPVLGEVLERLHTAWDGLDSAQGTMRLRYQPQRTHRAFENWRQGSVPGSVQELRAPIADRGPSPEPVVTDGQGPEVVEQFFRFWMAKPWRWRVETLAVAHGQVTEPRGVVVINGAIWWMWTAGNDVLTNARAPHPEQHEHSGVDRALLVMLDPASLAGTLRMSVAGSVEALGRQGVLVDCAARNSQIDPGLWPGAEMYRLLVETQHGILLRAEALQAGETYAETTFTDLILDETIPEKRFVFEAPPGAHIRYW